MLEYLKKAFWAGPTVPGLGRLPVNALAALGFVILGAGHPAFWLLGAGLEAAYLAAVASHPRFQRLVDAQRRSQAVSQTEEGRQELIRKLDSTARKRLALVEEKRERILRLTRETGAGAFELESLRDALDRILWTYLKLLAGRYHLEASRVHTTEAGLQQKIADLERSLAAADSSALRESQTATLKILQQRLSNLSRFEQTLKQVDADLARVEAQIDLAMENAGLRGSGAAAVTANLELASRTLDDELYFGDLETAALALDETYTASPPRSRERS